MPLDPITGSALLSGGASLLNSVGNFFGQKKANQANKDLAQQQNRDNVAMWQANNQYNHPTAQMQRLRQAGLNPNLIYGTGVAGSTGSSASPAKSYDRASVEPEQLNIGTPFEAFTNTKMQNAQIDNLREQNNVIIQDVALKAQQTAANAANTAKTVAETHIAKELREASLQASLANIRQTEALTRNTDERTRGESISNRTLSESQRSQINKISYEAQNAQQQLKGTSLDNKLKELDIELQKLGIQKSDPLYLRVLGRFLDDAGDIGNKIKEIGNRPFPKHKW